MEEPATTTPIQPLTEDGKFDRLLNKYSIIWIWSIITGLNSGITFSFYNVRLNHVGLLNVVIIVVYVMAFVFAIFTWTYLYKILRTCILPVILFDKKTPEETSLIKRATMYYTSRVFYFLVSAIAFRLTGIVVELIFNSLTKGD